MKEGNIVICCNEEDENYLCIGVIVDMTSDYIDDTTTIKFNNGNTVIYTTWKVEGNFQRFITERI